MAAKRAVVAAGLVNDGARRQPRRLFERKKEKAAVNDRHLRRQHADSEVHMWNFDSDKAGEVPRMEGGRRRLAVIPDPSRQQAQYLRLACRRLLNR